MPSELFERKLRDKFAHAEVNPRPELWQAIEKQLAPPPSRMGALYLLLFEILVIVVLFSFGTGYYLSGGYPAADASFSDMHADEPAFTGHTLSPVPALIPDSSADIKKISGLNTASPLLSVSPRINSPKVRSNPALSTKVPVQTDSTINISSRHTSTHPLNDFQDAETSIPKSGTTALTSLNYPLGSATPQEENKNSSQIFTIRRKTYLLDTDLHEPKADLENPILSNRHPWYIHGFINAALNLDRFAPFYLEEDLAVDYAYIYPSNVSLGSNSQIERLFSITYPKKSLTAGLHIEFAPTRRLSLQSGVNFTWFERGTYLLGEINPYPDNVVSSGPNNFSMDRVAISSPITFRYTQWEFPLWINLTVVDLTRSSLKVSFGGAVNFGHGSNVRINQADFSNNFFSFGGESASPGGAYRNVVTYQDPELLRYNHNNFYVGSSISYHYRLNEKLRIYAGPEFLYQLTPVYQGAGSNGQPPYRLGLKLGLAFTASK